MPASTALVPETVALQNLQSANALLGLTRAATMIAGPALAGVLVATASSAPRWQCTPPATWCRRRS